MDFMNEFVENEFEQMKRFLDRISVSNNPGAFWQVSSGSHGLKHSQPWK